MRVIVGLENSPIIPREVEIIHIVQDPQSPTWNTKSHQACLTWNPRAINLIYKNEMHLAESHMRTKTRCCQFMLSSKASWCPYGNSLKFNVVLFWTVPTNSIWKSCFAKDVFAACDGPWRPYITASDFAGPAHQTYKRDLGGKTDSPNPTYTATSIVQNWTDPLKADVEGIKDQWWHETAAVFVPETSATCFWKTFLGLP